jgi:hypothetical protein
VEITVGSKEVRKKRPVTRDNKIAIIVIIIVRLKLLNQRPYVYILMQKAVMFNTCRTVRQFWQNSE